MARCLRLIVEYHNKGVNQMFISSLLMFAGAIVTIFAVLASIRPVGKSDPYYV